MTTTADRTTCVSAKVRYPNRSQANKDLKWIKKAFRNAKTKRPYYCPWCYGWHLTKQKKAGMRNV